MIAMFFRKGQPVRMANVQFMPQKRPMAGGHGNLPQTDRLRCPQTRMEPVPARVIGRRM